MRRICTSTAVLLSLVGVALAAPGAASAGGGCHPGRPVTDERSTTVTMSDNCFVATVTRIDVGATVTFVNEDDAAHMVTGASYAWGMGSAESVEGELFKGDTFAQEFDESGVYPYFCILHPSMVGAIVVGDGTGDDEATQLSSSREALASTAPQPDRGSADADALTVADSGSNNALTGAVVAGGIALLVCTFALAKTLAARRAAEG